MISGHANVQMAIDSLKLGAFEFIQKPFSTERLLNFLNRAIENVELKKEKRVLENKLFHSYEIIGKSQTIEKVNIELKQIDYLGSFESDDETGSIFEQIKTIIKQLDKFRGEQE